MCQLKAMVEWKDRCETVMESVTGLEVIPDGVILSTYFEEPLTLRGVQIRSINLLTGAILLAGEAETASRSEG